MSPLKHWFLQWKSCVVWIRRETCTDQALFRGENSPEPFETMSGFWCESTNVDGLFHWRKHCYGLWIPNFDTWLKINSLTMILFLTNMLLFVAHNWWTGVVWITSGLLWCFYQLIGLSFWRHPFTAEDPLMSKYVFIYFWCNNHTGLYFLGYQSLMHLSKLRTEN